MLCNPLPLFFIYPDFLKSKHDSSKNYASILRNKKYIKIFTLYNAIDDMLVGLNELKCILINFFLNS